MRGFGAMKKLPAGDLVARYRANYGLGADLRLTEDMVLTHLRLERRLAEELLSSTPERRADVFERCYSELYRSLPWLGTGGDRTDARELAERGMWSILIGPPPRDVYEVGSGTGALARHLSALGYRCRATEITGERGDRRGEGGLTWGRTDGVHFDEFEPAAAFDAVISDQVIEHLHPDDLVPHLRSARSILRPGGRIAFATPHAFSGPHDVSRVFELDVPVGMHLHEYTYEELTRALAEAGLTVIGTPLRLPATVRARLGGHPRGFVSAAYLRYLIVLERLLRRLRPRRRRRAAAALRAALFPQNIVLVAQAPPKPAAPDPPPALYTGGAGRASTSR
jgi:SAM-dependent methyltransferase